MLGSILKYTVVMVVGAVGCVIAMHCGDDLILDEIKLNIKAVREKANADGEDSKAAVNALIDREEAVWRCRLTLVINLSELDSIVASARA